MNKVKIKQMKELVEKLNAADIAYYRDDNPIMTDREYDKLFDELKQLETETNIILSGSPTQKVSGEILDGLAEVRHSKPMLSADKTKSVEDLVRFAAGRDVIFSWKLDGLTLVLRYDNGELVQAITRGREGIVGEDVTHTTKTFLNIPLRIPDTRPIEIRGEGVISWANFEKINLNLEEPYKYYLKWNNVLTEIAHFLQIAEKRFLSKRFERIFLTVFALLYLAYDTQQEFSQQFERNIKKLAEIIKHHGYKGKLLNNEE